MNEQIALYLLFAFSGAVAGFIRFAESKRQWSWRVVITSVLMGSMISVAIIGWWFADMARETPIRCLALSLALGYAQPSLANIVSVILKSRSDGGA